MEGGQAASRCPELMGVYFKSGFPCSCIPGACHFCIFPIGRPESDSIAIAISTLCLTHKLHSGGQDAEAIFSIGEPLPKD